MAVNALTTTTLSAAINATQLTFQVASTANIAVGDFLAIDREMLRVNDIPQSGWVVTQRGIEGTAPGPHANGTTVYQGDENEFSYAVIPDGEIVATGDSGRLPKYALPVGTRRRDAIGNVYVLVDCTGTIHSGVPVVITDDYTAAAVGTTGRGRIGVGTETSTSDQLTWVQIYGRCLIQLGMADVSPSDAANGPTTLNTSLATVFILGSSLSTPNGIGWVSGGAAALTTAVNYVIEGMYVASDVSVGDVSAVTSATSNNGRQTAVFLNYPFIRIQEVTS